jgi:FKBP-type peptidyl-prolyl cis-trans isomerase 2
MIHWRFKKIIFVDRRKMRIYRKGLIWVQLMAVFFVGFLGVSEALAAGDTPVKKGDVVRLHYTGTLEDGSVFDTSKTRNEPLKFTAGSGQVIPGFDHAVMGMKKGEEKKFTIQPADAYGERKPEFTKIVPRKNLPQNHTPEKGMKLVMGGPNGQQIPATITEVTDENVTLDLNHPLAGKTLTFDIEIVEISH